MISSNDTTDNLLQKALVLWSVIGPILGGVATLFFRKWLVRYQVKQQELSNARQTFKRPFLNLVSELENTITDKTEKHTIIQILRKYHTELKKSMIEFNSTLPNRRKRSFKIAWINFSCEDYKEKGYPPHYEYFQNRDPLDTKNKIIANIEKLLKFAK